MTCYGCGKALTEDTAHDMEGVTYCRTCATKIDPHCGAAKTHTAASADERMRAGLADWRSRNQ